ncbi:MULTISPECIES: porin family protein [Butyricimonas]|mgnify:FL=1|uniref:porin family protein n=1 Tax=Butyricimonas TaxID=574697 RepID=UPI000363E8DC|nr:MULTISPECIES: porin family protein [Butyricimonas]
MFKKMLLLAVFCVGGMASLKAQQNWGIRGGLNMSTLDMTEAVFVGGNSNKYKEGFRIGFVGNVENKRMFSIQPGLYLSMIGSRFKGEIKGVKTTESDRLFYFQLPVLGSLNFKMKSAGKKWHLYAGPYVAYSIGGKAKFKEKGANVKVSLFTEGEDGEQGTLKKFDWGLTFGTGVTIKRLFVGLYYDLGMINIANKKILEGVTAKNRNFSLNFGVNF